MDLRLMREGMPPIPRFSQQRWLQLWSLLVLTVLLIAGALTCCFIPDVLIRLLDAVSPGCVFRRLSGISCPGCGGTRAARALLQGNVAGACRYNLLLPFALLMLVIEYARAWVNVFRGRTAFSVSRSYCTMVRGFVWLIIVWFFARNLFGI